ncbi:MAG: non-canonical purine NTP pyrophosphatase [Clostridia bacterium]|nr:non-canonical purine NTP pyrophosphatase [Clostridia bacterium]
MDGITNNKRKAIIATNNNMKFNEIKGLLTKFDCISLQELECKINEETIDSKESIQNRALQKAEMFSKYFNEICLADKAMLQIEKLNGWPGNVCDGCFDLIGDCLVDLTLELLGNYKKRNAIFTVATAIYYPNGKNIVIFTETLEGKITGEARGTNGLGFDKIFELSNNHYSRFNGKTLAELTNEEKKLVSPMRKAYKKVSDMANITLPYRYI